MHDTGIVIPHLKSTSFNPYFTNNALLSEQKQAKTSLIAFVTIKAGRHSFITTPK
jgi:hypothetical protein